MATFSTDWTSEELKAYILLYCSTADFVVRSKEKKLIKSKIDRTAYKKVKNEFKNDNDSDRLRKINQAVERLKGIDQSPHLLINDIMAMFVSDGSYSELERNLLNRLKILLR